MVRIAGVDVPDRKRAQVALRSIYGIGPVKAAEILAKLDLDPVQAPRMNELSDEQVNQIREISKKKDIKFIIATHNKAFEKVADSVYKIENHMLSKKLL